MKKNSGEKDKDHIWNAAEMRIKLAVEHLMTHEEYGLRTLTGKRDDFGFLNFKVDGKDDAFTRLAKLFSIFPTLEIMINSLELTMEIASNYETDLKYVDFLELSRVANLLRGAYKQNGGDQDTRRARRNAVALAYHRSTIAYVNKESRDSHYAKDQLNNVKEQYNNLINKELIEDLHMTASELSTRMSGFMTGSVPAWEIGAKPPKVKTDGKKKKNVPNDTGLAYAAKATPAKMCDKCKEMGLGNNAYTSHTTENHKEENAQRNKQKADAKKKAEKPASEAEAKA